MKEVASALLRQRRLEIKLTDEVPNTAVLALAGCGSGARQPLGMTHTTSRYAQFTADAAWELAHLLHPDRVPAAPGARP